MFDYLLQLEKFSPLLLGRIIFDKKLVSYAQLLETLLLLQKKANYKIGELLVEKKYITEKTLQEILQEQHSFLSVSPKNWQYIPNSVIKGSILFYQKPFGKLSQNVLDDYKNISPEESLYKIFVEEQQILSSSDIDSFLKNLEIVCWLCPDCLRSYHLFNYFPQKSSVMCSVCRTVELIPKDNTKIIVHRGKETIVENDKRIISLANVSKEIIEIPNVDTERETIFEISDFESASQISPTHQQRKIKPKKYQVFESKKFAKKQTQQKRYFYLLLVGILTLFLSIVLPLVINFDSPANNKNPMIINMDIQPHPRKKFETTTLKITETDRQKYQKIENMVFVVQTSRSILLEALTMLKLLIQDDVKSIYVADYYNLQSRIFLWLVWIDQGILTDTQKKELLQKSVGSFSKALELYQNGNKTNFFLRVMPWMFESTQYQIKPWEKSSQEFYYYDSSQVVVDVKSMLQMVKELLQK